MAAVAHMHHRDDTAVRHTGLLAIQKQIGITKNRQYRTTINASCAFTVAAKNKMGKTIVNVSQCPRFNANTMSQTVTNTTESTRTALMIPDMEPVDKGPIIALKSGNVTEDLKFT